MFQKPRILHVSLTSLETGLIEFDQDWPEGDPPAVEVFPATRLESLEKVSPELFALESGYFFADGAITFVLDPVHYPWLGQAAQDVRLAGEFNGWNPFADGDRWKLRQTMIAGKAAWAATFPDAPEFSSGKTEFKFVAGRDRWLSPPDEAPNRASNDLWNQNLEIDPARTGHHRYAFRLEKPADLSRELFLRLAGDGEPVLAVPGDFFYAIGSQEPLGAIVDADSTTFRVFAPRARRVSVHYYSDLNSSREQHLRLKLRKAGDGLWQGTARENLHGWYYAISVDGVRNRSLHCLPGVPIADPYALALVRREGPGIILDRRRLPAPERMFRTPQWQDLVIAELHVRDAIARAPIRIEPRDRLGFSGLRKWVLSDEFHLAKLGINAVELQPIQEFDNATVDEYHWGYMPVNFFAPASAYARYPERASQVREFQKLVEAFHQRGMAVILDVVYNHAGVPNHLLLIDKQYYFELDADGRLLNWSGCGNDLRPGAAMVRRLIVDSLVHLVELYGVDGFRFDLAELLGIDLLREIERRLKEVKPDVVLIAEPWSFRGHIGRQLRETGFSSWNDAFRDFMRGFVRGHAHPDAVRFFLTGSPTELAAWPAQTVNYTESHDDRTWIDVITENANHDGSHPTETDRRRTHLMAAFLFSAIGIPMIAAGQDFLRSKHGVSNTYQRGDLNALDYERLERFRSTHDYFAAWIRFRRSEQGRMFRLWSRPAEAYFYFAFADHASAFAVVFNADGSQGSQRLLLAINPHEHPVTIRREGDVLGGGPWRRLADAERLDPRGLPNGDLAAGDELTLPALDCGLWEYLGER